ncbi:putative reverse transcriptase, partial [Trifolium medium]|nr:putative reverse transcriptase [Trifolium medium]
MHGQYSVKSGYKLLLNVTGKVDVGSQQKDWGSLWTILAPPKAKHLLWRIIKGCLPIPSTQARQAAGLEQTIAPRLQQVCSAADVIFDICSTENKETTGTFAMLLWVLWNDRNNRVWNDMNEPGTSLGVKARHLWT